MAPKVNYTKEAIIAAALDAVRHHGVEALSARNVARELGGSTQPIYRQFTSITELKRAVATEARRIAASYSLEAIDHESAFLSIGLGYLAFSRAEPNVFRFLLLHGGETWMPGSDGWPLNDLVEKMRSDPPLSSLSEARLRELLRDMFIYTHGLSALQPQRPSVEELERERDLLRSVGGRLIILAVSRAGGGFDINSYKEILHDEDHGSERES